MDDVDVLVLAARPEDLSAAVATASTGVARWHENASPPFVWGDYVGADGGFRVALARPTRTGGRSVGPLATALVERLRPTCLAMSGTCAGNPSLTAAGDVVVAEVAYEWDEGLRSASHFEGDHQQFPLDRAWVRAAQDLDPTGLPSHGPADPVLWLLERLYLGEDPREHPARRRHFPPRTWTASLDRCEADGLITRADNGAPRLADAGAALVRRHRYDDVDGPGRLPFRVVVAPMASGSAVVEDDGIWGRLTAMGVRTIGAVELEAATLATVAVERRVPHWLVVKGVVDATDRLRGFAARASAEVLFALLEQLVPARDPVGDLLDEALGLLAARDYPQARSRFARCADLVAADDAPRAADAYFYQALATIGGRGFDAIDHGQVLAIEALLNRSVRRQPTSPHPYAVWAIVKEDYYLRLRYYAPERVRPAVDDLRRRITGLEPARAAEIVRHVPAGRSRTWRELHQMTGSP